MLLFKQNAVCVCVWGGGVSLSKWDGCKSTIASACIMKVLISCSSHQWLAGYHYLLQHQYRLSCGHADSYYHVHCRRCALLHRPHKGATVFKFPLIHSNYKTKMLTETYQPLLFRLSKSILFWLVAFSDVFRKKAI